MDTLENAMRSMLEDEYPPTIFVTQQDLDRLGTTIEEVQKVAGYIKVVLLKRLPIVS